MSQKTDDFIAKYKDAVIQASKGTGIFPSVTMAQMIIESGWGSTVTATKANNFFGIKADSSWKGPKMLFNTPNDAVKQNYFRVYNTPQDSVADHEAFLIQNSRYKTHGVFAANTPEQQAKDLAAAGYAEAKNYDTALIAEINAYHLKDLDKQAAVATGIGAATGINPATTVQITDFVKAHWAPMAVGLSLLGVGIYLLIRKK